MKKNMTAKKNITRITAFALSLVLLFGCEAAAFADGYDAEAVINEAVETVDATEEALDAIVFDEIEEVTAEELDTEDKIKEADDEVAAAEEAYNNAVEVIGKAEEDNAQAKADLETALAVIEKEEKNKEDLEEIHDQYYAMMVYYYRSTLGRNNAIYYEDGTLNIEANTEKLSEEKIDSYAVSPSSDIFLLGRDLTGKLVEYLVVNSYAAEDSDFEFATEGKNAKDAQEGLVFTNTNGVDQALAGKNKTATDINNETVRSNETYTQYWDNSTQGDGGRTNRVAAKYTDKDGNEQVKYFNYVFKSSEYGDVTDVEKGMFYLAEIKKEGNTWTVDRIYDENNYDDYSKLTSAIAAIKDYTKAKEDAEAALAKIELLSAKIEALEASKTEQKDRIDALNREIALAKEALANAKAAQNELEEAYNNAVEVIEEIELPETNETEVASEAAVIVPVVIAEAPVALAAAPEAEVVETEVIAEAEEINEAPVAEETAAVVEKAYDEVEVAEQLTAPTELFIDDEATALANAKAETEAARRAVKANNSANFMWIILLILTAATATLLYVYNRRKDEEEAEEV